MKPGSAGRLFVAVAVGAVVGILVILGLEQAEARGVGWFILVGFVLLLFPGILAVLLSAPGFAIRDGAVYGALTAASPLAVGLAYAFGQDGFADPIEVLAGTLFVVTAGLVGGATGAMAVAVVGALRSTTNTHSGAEQG